MNTRRTAVFTVTALGIFIASLDLSVVNVAFPSLQRSFPDSGASTLTWVITAYSIVFGALMVIAGRSADRFGRRRVFFLGLAVFCLGSAICATSPDVLVLIAGRVVQACGAACIVPSSMGLLVGASPVERRSHVVAQWTGVAALAIAIGPSVGAGVIAVAGWRWAFAVNLPVAAVAWLWGRTVLVESKIAAVASAPDYLGAPLLAITLGCLVLGISEGPTWGWESSGVAVSFAGFLLLGAVFVARCIRHPEPVLDLDLFRAPNFTLANAGALFYGAGFFALLLSNVLFLTDVWHYSVIRAGLAITPAPLIVAAMSSRVGRLAAEHDFRALVVPGALFFLLGLAWLLLRAGTQPAYLAQWLPGTLLVGLGIGLTIPVLNAAAVSSVPPRHLAVGGAVNQTARQVGGAIGVAVLVVLLGGNVQASHIAPADFQRVWAFCGAMAVLTGVVGALLRDGRAELRAAEETRGAA